MKGVRAVHVSDEASRSDKSGQGRRMRQQSAGKKIITMIEQYGEILSELVEDVFEDEEDSDGTGIYSVKIHLSRHIPQLILLDGRWIKVYYGTIQKLCTNCFLKHRRQDCRSQKLPWIEYVRAFIAKNMLQQRPVWMLDCDCRSRKRVATEGDRRIGEPKDRNKGCKSNIRRNQAGKLGRETSRKWGTRKSRRRQRNRKYQYGICKHGLYSRNKCEVSN